VPKARSRKPVEYQRVAQRKGVEAWFVFHPDSIRLGPVLSEPRKRRVEGLRTTHKLDELNNVREPYQQAINVKRDALPVSLPLRFGASA
jgi:hypothetical protein